MRHDNSPKSYDDELYTIFTEACQSIDHHRYAEPTEDIISKTRRLLELYRVCTWNVNRAANDIGTDLAFAARDYSEAPPDTSEQYMSLIKAAEKRGFNICRTWVGGRIYSISKTAVILQREKDALYVVRLYPFGGEELFDLLYTCYFDMNLSHNSKINSYAIRKLGYKSEQQYYKRKKEALRIFSMVFWEGIDRSISE